MQHNFPGLPDSVKPDWWRFLTGTLVGEVRAEAEGVPPLDMGKNSDTGPSYMPLGTAFRMASFRRNPNTALQFNTALCSTPFIEKDREKGSLDFCNYIPWTCFSSCGLFLGLCAHVNCKYHVVLETDSRFVWHIVEMINWVALATPFIQCKQDILEICWIKTNSEEKAGREKNKLWLNLKSC